VVSKTPIDWDFQRWRRTMQAYRIDGTPAFDPARRQDGEELDKLSAWLENRNAGEAHNVRRPIEPCPDILARTAGQRAVTDDNMGTEWRHFLGLD
jgi:spermidine synthase